MNLVPLITFIIPHRGRENLLIDTLQSISEQNFDLTTILVIIITQNDTISSPVRIFRDKFDLKIIRRPRSYTISALRNYGVARSDSEYLAFLDADIYISRNWIQTMLVKLNECQGRVICSAAQSYSNNATPLEKIRTALSNSKVEQPVNFLTGRNLFLKRSVFNKIGGFPEHLTTCEDYYFTNKADQLGELYYTSQTEYLHLGEDKNYSEMWKKEIWRGQSNLLSISGREIPLSELPSLVVPVGTFGMLVVGLLATAMGNFVITAISLLLFCVPVATYTARLHILAREHNVPLGYSLMFYLYYFTARAIGTIAGVFKTFKSRSHN